MLHRLSCRRVVARHLSIGLWFLAATALPAYTARLDNPAPPVFLPALRGARRRPSLHA